jgi:hypothetical protein
VPPALRAAVGFVLGLALWGAATPGYDRLLADAAEPVLRLLERPAATRLYAEGRRIVVDRAGISSRSERPSLPADDLTLNVILFSTLVATRKNLLRDRGILGLAAALGALGLTHVAALVCAVKSLYATGLGEWSAATYGPLSREFWTAAAHFYRVAGCWAIAFGLWWGLPGPSFRDEATRSGRRGPPRGGRRASRRRERE